jgi:hypothetical protein
MLLTTALLLNVKLAEPSIVVPEKPAPVPIRVIDCGNEMLLLYVAFSMNTVAPLDAAEIALDKRASASVPGNAPA